MSRIYLGLVALCGMAAGGIGMEAYLEWQGHKSAPPQMLKAARSEDAPVFVTPNVVISLKTDSPGEYGFQHDLDTLYPEWTCRDIERPFRDRSQFPTQWVKNKSTTTTTVLFFNEAVNVECGFYRKTN